jgi:hypothetical protein
MSEIRFAVVVDGEVAGTLSINSTNTDNASTKLIPALRSNPIIVEDTSLTVKGGWTYNGTEFVNPEA